jgi:TPR repeat protein
MKIRNIIFCAACYVGSVVLHAESQMPKTLTPSKSKPATTRQPSLPATPNPNSEEAKMLAELMAKVAANDPKAMQTYGQRLLTGSYRYIQQNETLGISYLEKAAAKGQIYACLDLAMYYGNRAKGSQRAGFSESQRPTGTDSELLAESIKWSILYGSDENTMRGVSDSTKAEGRRRADVWSSQNYQSIPVEPK